jgi:hypothetical protein
VTPINKKITFWNFFNRVPEETLDELALGVRKRGDGPNLALPNDLGKRRA